MPNNALKHVLLGIAILCAYAPSIVVAADARQCALADAMEKRISTVLELPAPCLRDDQCTVAHFGCPFPCASVVGASQREILEATVKDYRRAQIAGECSICAYKCQESAIHRKGTCVANRCVLGDAE